MTNRDAPPVRLGYEIDTASEARVKQSTDQFVENLRRMAAGTDAAAASAQKSARTLAEAFDAQNNTVKATVRSETAELAKLRDQFDQTGAAAKKGLSVEGLRRTGGALSQLGFGEVGGAVSRVGDVGQIAESANNLVESLGPLAPVMAAGAGAAIGYQVGLKILDAELADGKKALEGAVAGLDAYYAALQRGTTDSIQNQLKALKQKNDAELAELNQLKQARDNAFKSEQSGFGGDARARVLFGLGDLTGAFKATDDRIAELEKSTIATSNQIAGMTRALDSTAVTANDAAEALRAQQSETMKQLDISVQAKRQELADSKLSSDQMKSRLKDLKDEQAIIQSQLQVLEPLIATNEEAKKKYEALQSQMVLVNTEIQGLTNTMIPAAEAAEKLKASMQNIFEKAAQTADKVGAQITEQGKELEARNARVAALQQKYNDDVKSIEQKSLAERADIQQKYNDRLTEIVRNTADAIDAATRNLQRTEEDNAIGLDRADQKAARDAAAKRLDIQVKAQQEEAKALRQHEQDLARIKADAADREFDLIASRDFAGLFASRRQTSRDLERANTDFTNQDTERRAGLQTQFDDLKRSMERERQERIIAANQQLEDARRTYARALQDERRKRDEELKLANETRTKDLQQLSAKTAAELRIKNSSYDAELRMAALYGKARVDAEAATQRALLAQANVRLAQLTSGASGGVYMTQNTSSSSNRTVNVNASGYGANDVTNQIISVVRQIFK